MGAVEPIIDRDFAKSWDGVNMAAQMRRAATDPKMDNADRLYCLIEYYSHVVENLDDVVESLGGGSVDASTVFAYVNSFMAGELKN